MTRSSVIAFFAILGFFLPSCGDRVERPPSPVMTGHSPDAGSGGQGGGAAAVCPSHVPAPAMVKDIASPGGSSPARLFTNGCVAYFNVVIGPSIFELWRTDGTDAGTTPVVPSQPLYFGQPHALGDIVFFNHQDSLWRTDGTASGTYVLMDGWALPYFLTNAAVLGGRLILNARDATQNGPFVESQYGVEPWISDGTKAGTKLLADVVPGPEPVIGGPEGFTRLGERLLFWTGPLGSQTLFQTDGSAAGTAAVGKVSLVRAELFGAEEGAGGIAAGGHAFFVGESGGEVGLWASNGTSAGTSRLIRLDMPLPGGTSMFSSQDRFAMAELNGVLYLYASSRKIPVGEGAYSYYGPPVDALYQSDGTVGGTKLVLELPHQDYSDEHHVPMQIAAAGGRVYFFSLDETAGPRPALYGSDGSAAGTNAMGTFEQAGTLVAMGNAVYFHAGTLEHGMEIFRGEGTATSVLKDIWPGPEGSGFWELSVIGGKLYFAADDGQHGMEPWISDGTEAGTMLAGDLFPGSGSSFPGGFNALGDVVLFSADNGTDGFELWKM